MSCALDAPYDRLAALPKALWLPALTTSAGDSAQRLDDIAHWLGALAQGVLPAIRADFGDATATAGLRAVAAELDLASLCPGAPALAQQLMRTLLWHLDRLIDLQPALTRARAIAQVASEFQAAWVSEKGDWDAVRQLLHSLGDLPELGWEGLRGLLRRREWREAQRIAERLEHMPELVALVDRLGRSQRAPRTEPLPPPLAGPAGGDIGQVWVQTRLPDAPGELHGIRLSGRIESMLPSQAAMLRHPVLRKLWRARRAEARLLAYDSQAWLADLRPDPRAAPRQASVVAPPQVLERGPSSSAWTPRARCAVRPRPSPRRWR